MEEGLLLVSSDKHRGCDVAFFAPPLIGHMVQMVPIAEELADRGYAVTFVAPSTLRHLISTNRIQFFPWDSVLPSATPTTIYSSMRRLFQSISNQRSIVGAESKAINIVAQFYSVMFKASMAALSSIRPRLCVVERSIVSTMDAARTCNIDYLISAQYLGTFGFTTRNRPQFGTSYTKHMSALEMLSNRLWNVRLRGALLPATLNLAIRRGIQGINPLSNPFSGHDIIVGSSMRLDPYRRPHYNVHLTGPIVRQDVGEEIDHELRNWLNEHSGKPVVYVAFGTLAALTESELNAIIKGLQGVEASVLWSASSMQEMIPRMPIAHSFKVREFLPQSAVLKHPAVKLFITHCGMNGMIESLYSGKPVLAIPFFGDQFYNSARIVDLGVGLRIAKRTITSDAVRRAVIELLQEPKYLQTACQLGSFLRNENGRVRAADIVEGHIPMFRTREMLAFYPGS